MSATPTVSTALVTPANLVTGVRVLLTPVLVALILAESAWLAFGLWVVLAATDRLDGWLARRHGVTSSGAFLDPLADKILVVAAAVALVEVGVFPLLPVLIIAARELAMSAYRSVVGRRGVSVPARPLAKGKTAVQLLAVGVALFPPFADDHALIEAVLWAAVVLTVVSGLQYLVDARRSVSMSAGDHGAL